MSAVDEFNDLMQLKRHTTCTPNTGRCRYSTCPECEMLSEDFRIRFLSNFYREQLNASIGLNPGKWYSPTESECLYLALNYPNLYKVYINK